MKITNKKSILVDLEDYCIISPEHSYMEVTEWNNGEGVDVDINGETFDITYGQFYALKKMIEKLNKK